MYEEGDKCPHCGEGTLEEVSSDDIMEKNDYLVCDYCNMVV